MTSTLALGQIRINGGTQSRERLNQAVVLEYADAMALGERFDPVVCFYDGETYWLADGFHRYAACGVAFGAKAEISAEVRQGDQRAAVLYSCGANAKHGLRRTNADKRRAAQLLLSDSEWKKWSDRKIAEICGVAHKFISGLRKELLGVSIDGVEVATVATCLDSSKSATANTEPIELPSERAKRLGSDGKQYPVNRFGPPPQATPVVTRQQEDFVEDSLEVSFGMTKEGGYFVATSWDSIQLSPQQALDLYGDLAQNSHKLRRALEAVA